MDHECLKAAYEKARDALLECRTEDGHWTGRLSASSLATATAVSALALYRKAVAHKEISDILCLAGDVDSIDTAVQRGISWLRDAQNRDGGWGDTDQSFSNIATTFLVKSAFILAGGISADGISADGISAGSILAGGPKIPADQRLLADQYLIRQGGVEGLRKRYGRDQTFSVPILMNAALAGIVPWRKVPQLPFELAAFPHAFFRFLKLPVVSYAIPALVAIGLIRYQKCAGNNFLMNFVRKKVISKTLQKIHRMQPESGGYLEAPPLTAFVTMSLIGSGFGNHPVVQNGIRFLLNSVRNDGSWPIDTNLAIWGTTLAVNSLAADSLAEPVFADSRLLDWILDSQNKEKHPFTETAPGGWGWTNLSGSVPDADDTSGALLALAKLYPFAKPEKQSKIIDAVVSGIHWLLNLQNRDGGMPTFCRGWGKLPFDRSSVDLTAHALRAFLVWRDYFEKNRIHQELLPRMKTAIRRGNDFIKTRQNQDGSWTPLWFGNQFHPQEENPVYGTAKVLCYYGAYYETAKNAGNHTEKHSAGKNVGKTEDKNILLEKINLALDWALEHQNRDGGWGCREEVEHAEIIGNLQLSSIEETALMLEGLAPFAHLKKIEDSWKRGLGFLVEQVESGKFTAPTPIGLYFAKLWYYEKLYPLVFTTAALRQFS